MTFKLNIDQDKKTPKYIQVVDTITEAIRLGKLKKGERILSINELSDEYFLSRDTVEKAYNILRKQGIISSVRGKGFYIRHVDVHVPYKVLLIFNKISNYKKQIYQSFINTLGHQAIVDLKIHHSNTQLLQSLIENHLEEYNYIVIMPHFYDDAEVARKILNTIPSEKLILLDKTIPHMPEHWAAVYQDFENDIVEALENGMDLIKKYNQLYLVHPKLVPYPPEIVKGFRTFCMQYRFSYQVIPEIEVGRKLNKGEAYIVIEETDLVNLIKNCRSENMKIGKDIGIISYNETPLKEILQEGITVISTDHIKMGETAAKLILENKKEKVKNNFELIRRKSL
ncbi:GntR family transcriptional regulator [Pollutibacter soli]|uniref:GntR family transcriptional regulator n=1 Tax=Pollutibacter soli TaxID=3034157 RepID=UPI0030136FD8